MKSWSSVKIPAVASLALIAVAPVVAAIVIRDDKPDSDYVVDPSRYPAVVRVSGFAQGTLIGDQWVLTASHVAMGLNPFNAFVTLGGHSYRVDKAFFHPSGLHPEEGRPIDMAILRLAKKVNGVAPCGLYVKQDEVGQTATLVGEGDTGNGLTGPTDNDGKTRAAQNRIEKIDGDQIVMTFDAPPNALPREGISGPGDSGGPALLKSGNRYLVAGVSNSNSEPPGERHCKYGTQEFYARVSTQAEWIKGVMAGKDAPDWGWNPPTNTLPDTEKAKCAAAFFKAFDTDDRATIEKFDNEWRDPETLKKRTPDQRWALMQMLRRLHGDLTPEQYAVSQPGSIAVLAKRSVGGHLAMEFIFAQGGSKLIGFTVVDVSSVFP